MGCSIFAMRLKVPLGCTAADPNGLAAFEFEFEGVPGTF